MSASYAGQSSVSKSFQFSTFTPVHCSDIAYSQFTLVKVSNLYNHHILHLSKSHIFYTCQSLKLLQSPYFTLVKVSNFYNHHILHLSKSHIFYTCQSLKLLQSPYFTLVKVSTSNTVCQTPAARRKMLLCLNRST